MYEMWSRIKYSEVGEDGKLMLHQLINLFQDCSTFHLEDLQIAMPKPNLAFYMLSWQIEINRLPGLGEKVKVATLMHEGKGAFGYRNYALYDEGEQILAYANMCGCFVDVQTENLVKLTQEERAVFPLEEKFEMEYLPRKIKIPACENTFAPITVQQAHIDMNHHVNNSQYVAIGGHYLPEGWEFSRVRIEYKKAAKRGDCLIPQTVMTKDGNFYLMLGDEYQKPYVTMEFSV